MLFWFPSYETQGWERVGCGKITQGLLLLLLTRYFIIKQIVLFAVNNLQKPSFLFKFNLNFK